MIICEILNIHALPIFLCNNIVIKLGIIIKVVVSGFKRWFNYMCIRNFNQLFLFSIFVVASFMWQIKLSV